MSKLSGEVLTLPKMSGSVSTPKPLNGNVGAKTINIGEDGATFIPSVSADGVISWTNDKELPNPDPVNIKGEAGYTPQKGVDYFDGKNGADGKDGYTPQKGVDYFDGKDGQNGSDGKDGQDGTSPIISVLAIAGGHRITITDKNGTKSVDVLDGQDGKDGSNGATGSAGKDGSDATVTTANITNALGYTPANKTTVDSLSKEIADLKNNGASGTVENIQTYITEDIGELYPAVSGYTAWCPCTLHFDKVLDKFVSLIYGAPAHVHTTSDLFVSYIDKNDFTVTEPVKCSFVASDGTTDITPAKAGTTSWLILNDGTYLMIHGASDGNTHRFVSEDNGITWKSTGTTTGGCDCPWFITELSNGRLICSDDSTKVGFYYSDDVGFNWTQVIPTTCGGDYEAEACILELKENTLMAIARNSMSGQGAYSSGDSEHAIISYSYDNGTTWSAWQLSNTIDNMNASSCTGLVHDGVVEIFTTSRWYALSGNTNTDNTNTGKNGGLLHYTATIDNALKDNFTRKGILDYAKGAGGEFHSPCLAIDDNKNILICHMDGGKTVTCNHRYLRGALDNLDYLAKDGSNSSVKSYSAKYVDVLVSKLTEKVNELQYALSQLPDSGVTPPTGTLIWTRTFDASTATDVIHRNSESDFYEYTTVTDYPNSTTIHCIGTDVVDNQLTMQTFDYVITVPIEKENFAVLLNGRGWKLAENKVNASMGMYLNVYIDNKQYYYTTALSSGLPTAEYNEVKMVYSDGKLILTVDGNEINPTITELTSDSEHYGVNKVVIGKNANIYCCYRTIKFGEWDSE